MDPLCSSGADVRAVDNEGMTALHKAAAQGHLLAVDKLLSQGSEANKLTKVPSLDYELLSCRQWQGLQVTCLRQGCTQLVEAHMK